MISNFGRTAFNQEGYKKAGKCMLLPTQNANFLSFQGVWALSKRIFNPQFYEAVPP